MTLKGYLLNKILKPTKQAFLIGYSFLWQLVRLKAVIKKVKLLQLIEQGYFQAFEQKDYKRCALLNERYSRVQKKVRWK